MTAVKSIHRADPALARAPQLARWRTWATAAATAAACLLVVACGGGGIAGSGTANDGNAGTNTTGGTPSTALSYGAITDFGSVWVNGVEFKSSSATIRLDDSVHPESDLRRGMVVRVEGSISAATANVITVEDALKGYVELAPDANRLVVMGQSVQLDANTRYENGVRPVAGDAVHVHGLVVADGKVSASYVEKKTALGTPPFAVRGYVRSHDTAARSFVVGALSVSYGSATVSDLPAGSWNGLLVEVKGGTCAARPVCGTLSASKVEPAGARLTSSSSIAQAEVEGYVTAVAAGSFTVGGQTITVNGNTRYEGGTLADVVVGTKLEAEGSVSGGVLVASKVSLRDSVRLEGDIASLNAASGTLTLAGLPGLSISANSLTAFDKVSGVSGLALGQHLRLRGRSSPAGVQAGELELRSTQSDSRVILQGPISASTGFGVTILGVAVDLATVSDSNFTRSIGQSSGSTSTLLGRAAFFAALKTSTVVKLRGERTGSAIRWTEAEIEED